MLRATTTISRIYYILFEYLPCLTEIAYFISIFSNDFEKNFVQTHDLACKFADFISKIFISRLAPKTNIAYLLDNFLAHHCSSRFEEQLFCEVPDAAKS